MVIVAKPIKLVRHIDRLFPTGGTLPLKKKEVVKTWFFRVLLHQQTQTPSNSGRSWLGIIFPGYLRRPKL